MPFASLFCHKFVLLKSVLSFLGLVMQTYSFTWLKLRTPISNLKLKQMVSYLIFLPLHEEFARGVPLILLYTTVTEVLSIFLDANARIKGAQIGDDEIKQLNKLVFLTRYYLPYQTRSDFKTIKSFYLKDELFKKTSPIGCVI